MSYWYEPKKEDIKVADNDLDIYLGTEPAYDDCGNIYCSVKLSDVKEVIKAYEYGQSNNKKK